MHKGTTNYNLLRAYVAKLAMALLIFFFRKIAQA